MFSPAARISCAARFNDPSMAMRGQRASHNTAILLPRHQIRHQTSPMPIISRFAPHHPPPIADTPINCDRFLADLDALLVPQRPINPASASRKPVRYHHQLGSHIFQPRAKVPCSFHSQLFKSSYTFAATSEPTSIHPGHRVARQTVFNHNIEILLELRESSTVGSTSMRLFPPGLV